MEKIKIFVSYKNRTKLLQNEILTPIQTGRAIADEIFDEMIGDDTGDNISKYNERFCELTAQYWVWKNYEQIGNPEYVGFMHNRRHFVFDSELKHLNYRWLPKTNFYFVDHIYDNYIEHFSFDKITPYFQDAPDCIVYKKVDIKPISGQKDMRSHFYKGGMPGQRKDVFDALEKVIKGEFKDYYEVFLDFKNNHYMYCCNSFVMKKDLFFEYSDFLFKVLMSLNSKIDSSKFNAEEIRFLGFVGEYLMSTFIMNKLKQSNFKLKELDGTFVSKNYKNIEKKINKYKIMRQITFGKKRKYYLKKYALINRLILVK